MANRAPAGDPAQRLPWILLSVVVLLVVIGLLAYFANQRGNNVTLNIEGTPSAVARSPSVGPPPTLVAPTLPPSQPTTTPAPSPTPLPSPTAAPTPVPPTAPPKPAAAGSPAPPAAAAPAPTAAPPAQATAPAAAPASPPPTQPSPTPFAGQVSAAGGSGNTRTDLQSAFGNPTGETPDHLVVFRKDNTEYHVEFVPDLNGRAATIVELPPQGAQPWTQEAAIAEARKLLPRDVQPPNAQPEGNNQFVVQHFTSQSLAQALGSDAFTAVNAQPGEMMAVYARDQSGRITRIIVGIGSDPNALLSRGR